MQFALVRFEFVRKSDVVPRSLATHDSLKDHLRGTIVRINYELYLTLMWSKTIQYLVQLVMSSSQRSYFLACTERLGLDPSKHGSHCFRKVIRSWVFRAGVPRELLEHHGDCLSTCYLRYFDYSLSQRLAVTQRMARNFSGQ